MALAITMQPCCLLLQALVQELGYISIDTIFSEQQAEKDIRDRKIAPMKTHIRQYVNKKHDVATAANMKEALKSHGGVTRSRVAVAAINLANKTGGTNKIKGISKLNNFGLTDDTKLHGNV